MGFAFYMLAGMAGLTLLLISSYWRWQKLVERERFFLAMKEASTPESMRPEERSRLELLRSPWWAVWRWLPDLLGRPNAWLS
jgi:hypothetical protein